MQYLIIGNSVAAVNCVEGIRSLDREGEITIVSAEGDTAYSRPLISYLLQRKTTRERMDYRPDSFYRENSCRVYSGTRAEKLNARKRTVTLSGKEELCYDKLLIAVGSTPRRPEIPGLAEVKRCFCFTTMDDALALEQELTAKSRVLIVGAGLVGLKCAEGVFERAGSVTVVEQADRLLPGVLDAQAAQILQKHMEECGVRFFLSRSVEALEEETAVLSDGERLSFDILVLAAGVVPNTGLVRRAGGAAEQGILVDTACRTSLPDVWAAGDCTQGIELLSGEPRVLALLPNAAMQGYCAGVNMAGGTAFCDKMTTMNAAGFFGLHIITAGSCDGEGIVETDGEKNYKKLVVRDGTLCGYILMGRVERAGIYTSLIRERTPLSEIDFELIRQKPQLMAFSRKVRAEKLGGAV